MNISTYLARKQQDFSCANLNDAVGVDDCAAGAYCIDTQSIPSRCVNLSSPTTCFMGREAITQICVYASSTGPN
jgi:hypothetical protein